MEQVEVDHKVVLKCWIHRKKAPLHKWNWQWFIIYINVWTYNNLIPFESIIINSNGISAVDPSAMAKGVCVCVVRGNNANCWRIHDKPMQIKALTTDVKIIWRYALWCYKESTGNGSHRPQAHSATRTSPPPQHEHEQSLLQMNFYVYDQTSISHKCTKAFQSTARMLFFLVPFIQTIQQAYAVFQSWIGM